jgi:hypothetical protein
MGNECCGPGGAGTAGGGGGFGGGSGDPEGWWSINLPNTTVVRKEARSLPANEVSRISNAYLKMRENKNGKPGTSEYFRLAVMHGGFPGLSRSEYPEFCCHGREAFCAWHRPYLLEFERSMRRADIALGGDGNIGLPYWDWSKTEVNGQVLPGFVRNQLMVEFPSDFFPSGAQTSGFLMSNTSSDSRIARGFQGARLGEAADSALKVARHAQAVCTKWEAPDSSSLESPHNSVHGIVGGIMAAFQSSFHPVFWMHHCNIDRYGDKYIELQPDSAREFEAFQKTQNPQGQAGFPDGPWGRYLPFTNHVTGEVFHARDCYDISKLGYRYDVLPEVSPLRMREPPHLAFFKNVDINKLGQCRMLYVYVKDKSKSWSPPYDKTPEGLVGHEGFAGSQYIFFAGSQHCRNCMDRAPFNIFLDVTQALRTARIRPENCELKVLVDNIEDKTVTDISETPMPVPVLRGPRFHSLEGGAGEAKLKEFYANRIFNGDHVENVEGGGGLKAKRGESVTWSVHKDSLPGCIREQDVISDLEKAFKSWEDATGLKFQMGTGYGNARINIKFSEMTLDYEGKFDGPGGKLADTTASTITFDGSERWEAGGRPHALRNGFKQEDSFFNPFFKLQPVALHEIGHVLGLGHSAESGDVMAPYYSEGRTALTANDKRRAQALF